MKSLVLTGNSSRHLYFLNQVSNYCNLQGAIIEERTESQICPPPSLSEEDHKTFLRHFNNRNHFEKVYFPNQNVPLLPKITYIKDSAEPTQKEVDFIKEINPDVIFVFGVLSFAKKIRHHISENISIINLNTGLLQRYDGDATLFWPFYFLEPNWAGSTFFLLNENHYSNNIIQQSVPILERGDTIHQVACKVVIQATTEIPRIIEALNKRSLHLHQLKSKGKLFTSNDFMPQHLRVIYNLYNGNIVDLFLDKKITPRPPKLIRQQGG